MCRCHDRPVVIQRKRKSVMTPWDEWIREKEQDEGVIPFVEGIEVWTWTFECGSKIEITKYPPEANSGAYSLCGNIRGKDIHDEDYEDYHFANSDALIDFLRQNGLLSVLKPPQAGD